MTEPAPNDAARADEAGRPRGSDELDPELIKLPRRRGRIGPVMALAVVVLAAVILWRLRGDLAFSRQDATPRPIDIRALATAAPDRFVALTARPDRSRMLHIFASRARDGHRVAPLL